MSAKSRYRPRRRLSHPVGRGGTYLEKLLELAASGAFAPGSVHNVVVRHDGDCGSWEGLPCDCAAELEVETIAGPEVAEA